MAKARGLPRRELVKAGREKEKALTFASLRLAYEFHRPFADEGQHWAWNICYALEDSLNLVEAKGNRLGR